MTNTNDTLKWVAGGIFAFAALLSLVDFFQYHPSGFGWVLLNLLELVAFVVITVGIFANVKILTSVEKRSAYCCDPIGQGCCLQRRATLKRAAFDFRDI